MTTALPTGTPLQGPGEWARVLALLGANVVAGDASPARRRVLMPTTIGGSVLFQAREGLLGHALRMRGGDVHYVVCDGLPTCDARTFDNDSSAFCASCAVAGPQRLRAQGHDVALLSDLLTDERASDLWRIAHDVAPDDYLGIRHRDCDVGRHAWASTLRWFRAGAPAWDDTAFLAKAREMLAIAMITAEGATSAMASLDPDVLVSSHGTYAQWGPWVDAARAGGIPFVVYSGGWRRNTILLAHDRTDPRGPQGETSADLRPLGATEAEELDRYLATRETNAGDAFRLHDSVSRDLGDMEGARGRRVALFTNVTWDEAAVGRAGGFEDVFDWLLSCVDWAAARPDVDLVVKAHPAEAWPQEPTPERWRVGAVLAASRPALPTNVRLVGPEEGISTFALYDWADVGLVNTSTVGLEMALAGVPVVTSGAPIHYAIPGIVHAASSRADFFATLERALDGSPPVVDVDLARRYAHHLFFRRSVPFEPIDVEGWDPVALRVDGPGDLAPGRLPGLDALCRGILEGAPFLV